MNNIYQAFDNIKADEQLKDSTMNFLTDKINAEHKTTKVMFRPKYVALVTLCICFLSVVIGGSVGYYSPVSNISIDVNPSIELVLNKYDRVISSKAYNDDGAEIIDNLNVSNKTYSEAVDIILNDETFSSYLDDDAELTFTVVSPNETEIIDDISNEPLCQQYSATYYTADKSVVSLAHENGMSVGKYQAYLEVSSYDPSITIEQCKDMSMREIKNILATYTNTDTSNGNGNGNNGNGNNGNSNGNGYAYGSENGNGNSNSNSNSNGNGNGYHGGR